MFDRLKFLLNRVKERLWVKPLLMCLISILGLLMAKWVERLEILQYAPKITIDSIETLLTTLSASMLVIATFAVGSMVSSYSSASNIATPRTFPLVISDDVSQNALSMFIGSFIYSVVATIAVKNSYYDVGGRFVLFFLTILVFILVILTFVRWVDRIARLGRLGTTIDKVETVTTSVLQKRRKAPTMACHPAVALKDGGSHIYTSKVGYVQRVDISALQEVATQLKLKITLSALPGTFAAPGRAIAYAIKDEESDAQDQSGNQARGDAEPYKGIDRKRIEQSFVIGDDRTFDEDPRFGLIVLSEIASRALSPAVNDPGTAIDIIGTLVRMLVNWVEPLKEEDVAALKHDRVFVPAITMRDMFDDAFTGIARDGASSVEVVMRLQKALGALATIDNAAMRDAAAHHARLSLARAEQALAIEEDKVLVRALAEFAMKKAE